MPQNAAIALVLASLAGAATMIGGVFTFFLKKNSFKALSYGLSFSAGVMLFLSFMEIMPEAQKDLAKSVSANSARIIATAGFFVGIILSAIIDRIFPEHISGGEVEIDGSHIDLHACHTHSKFKKSPRDFSKLGIFAAVDLTIHNFPEGLSVFISGVDNISLGMSIAIAIALHNIPEGISVALPIYITSGSRKKALFYTAVSSVAEPLGAVCGMMFLAHFSAEYVLGAFLAFTAGIMVYLSIDELLPAAKEYEDSHESVTGVIGGMMLMAVVSYFF
ncbi:MAG: zinc transporter ZupT [Opitutales bacterium]|nr:zinc transporter ZupT [Opitutales bacterium]